MLNWLSQKQLDLKIWWDFQSFEQEESDRHREWAETAFSTSAVSEKLAEVKALALSEAENRFGERLADLRADRAAAIVERDWLEKGLQLSTRNFRAEERVLKDRDFALRQKRAQFRYKRNASLTPLKVAIQEKRAFRLEKGFFDNNEEEFQDLKETILEHQIQVAEAERELNEIDLQLAQLDAGFRCLRKDYADFRDNFSASGFDPQVAQQRVPDLEKRAEDLGRILDDTEADREAFIITRERELGAGSLEAEIRSLKRQKRVADGRFKSRAALDERKVRHREMYLAGQRAGTEAIRRQEP